MSDLENLAGSHGDICALWSVVKCTGQRNQQNSNKDISTNSCWIWIVPISNKRAKKVDVNKAMIYPKQQETYPTVSS